MKWIKVIIKALISFNILFGLFAFIVGYVVDRNDTWESSYTEEMAQEYYEEGRYGYLRMLLHLYDFYDEKFDVYWEAVDGYRDYQEALQYKQSGDEEEKEAIVEKVIGNARKCKFESNQTILDTWAKEVQQEDF